VKNERDPWEIQTTQKRNRKINRGKSGMETTGSACWLPLSVPAE